MTVSDPGVRVTDTTAQRVINNANEISSVALIRALRPKPFWSREGLHDSSGPLPDPMGLSHTVPSRQRRAECIAEPRCGERGCAWTDHFVNAFA